VSAPTLGELLTGRGWRVERVFGERQDSRSAVLGVVDGATGQRHVVKHAEDPEAIAWLESAARFHAAVRHPAIPTVVGRATTATGLALVEEWGAGEILVDGYDAAVLPREDERSAYRRFLRLPADEIAEAVDQLIEVHIAVAAAGFVAVDLYDGCVLYDFAERRVALVDLDHYRPGPYVLDVDRQLGSASYMAPEEHRRGATIDERSTAFTLGRMALVYLGCERKGPARRADFRGSDEQFAVASAACAADPADRVPSVSELRRRWRAAG
jgi:hypothetical protein